MACQNTTRHRLSFSCNMNKVFRFIAGTVFLLSGLLKAIDAAAFADLMSRYGDTWLGLGAPLIILVEVIVGLLLVFDVCPKYTAMVASAFLLLVSIVYLYGICAKGINDCGCFGPLTWLNTKPWLTFLRNIVLLGLLVPSMLASATTIQLPVSSITFMAVIATIVMFMCGFSFRGANCLQRHSAFRPTPLAETPLSDYINTHPDSTYLVFAFSYTCPYCQNSIGNVNQYRQIGVVDQVIGLALNDTIGKERFYRLFDINFEVHEIPAFSMVQISTTLPAAFFIRHDSVMSQYSGLIPSPALMVP